MTYITRESKFSVNKILEVVYRAKKIVGSPYYMVDKEIAQSSID